MRHKKMAFFGLCLGFFIVMMDTTTVPLIYTVLMAEYRVSPAMAAWVNNIYLITYAGFLLFGGRLGDAFDRKIILGSALLVLAAGALLSGAGRTLSQVLIGRALMGMGAGLLTPQSMAFISTIFAQGGRGTALGIWGAIAGIATATGPVVTQLFLQIANWRWVMWINVPIAMLALATVAICLPTTLGNGLRGKELLSSALFGVALASSMLGLQFLQDGDIGDVTGWVLLLLGAFVSVLLVWQDFRHGTQCLLPMELWQDRAFLRICLVSGFLGFGLTAFYLPLAFLIEVRMGFGPVAISVIMITIALANALVGPFAGHFSDKAVPEAMVRAGMTVFALAALLTGTCGLLGAGSSIAFIAMIIAMALAGIGTGLAFAPLANLALSRATFPTVGRAAAFFNTVRQMMSALGSVAIAALFDGVVSQLQGRNTSLVTGQLQPFSPAVAFAAFACFLFIACCLSLGAWLSRRRQITQSVI